MERMARSCTVHLFNNYRRTRLELQKVTYSFSGGKANECAVKYHCTVAVIYRIYFKKKAFNPTVHKKRGLNIIFALLECQEVGGWNISKTKTVQDLFILDSAGK